MTGIYLIINIVIIILFIAGFLIFNTPEKKLLILSAVYAAIFENFNMFFSRGLEAGYYYDANFKLFIFDTPLFVILSWSLLITGSYCYW